MQRVDPLTHTLLGASLGYACYGRRLGRTAAAVGAVAGLLPDADVFLQSSVDPLFAVEMHRGFSHSLFFAPWGALVAAAPFFLAKNDARHRVILWACALAAYVSHCLLDGATSYGTNLLWPFSKVRVGWDIIAVVDPLVTLPLLSGLGWALFRKNTARAVLVLGIVGGYLCLGALQHRRAMAAHHELATLRGHLPDRSQVMPTLGNLLVWRALYLHEGKIHSDRVRVGRRTDAAVLEGWSLPVVEERDLTPSERAAAVERNSFARFSHFSDGWVARSPEDPTLLADMRYSLSPGAFDPIWGIRFGPAGSPDAVAWINRSADRRVDPQGMWAEIVGRDPRYIPVATVAANPAD